MSKKACFIWAIGAVVLLAVLCIFLWKGCSRAIEKNFESYFVSSNFIDMSNYSAKEGKYLGKGEDPLDNIYELKGLDSDEYLYRSEGHLTGTPSICLMMDKTVQEPILRFQLSKIEIRAEDDTVVSIDDKKTLNEFIDLRKTGLFVETEWVDPLQLNTTIHFDLPCELTLNGRVVYDAFSVVHFICYDVSSDTWRDYDMTAALGEPIREAIINRTSK